MSEAVAGLSGRVAELAVVAEDEVRGRRLLAALARGGVGSASRVATVDDVLASSDVGSPRVAVVSSTAGQDGLAAIARLRELGCLRILVSPEATRAEVRAVLAAGVDGLVLESRIEESLVPTVHAVAAGQLVLPRTERARIAPPALSTREKQVLGLVVLGFSNAEIAAKLHVAETTVKSHLNASFRKLDVRSRSEASARILDPHEGVGLGILSIAGDDASLDLLVDP